MALTTFTAQGQIIGPIAIPRERGFSVSLQGSMAAGSVVDLQRSPIEEESWRTVKSFTSATSSTDKEADFISTRGWKYRLICSTFVAPDAPAGELR